MKLFYVPQTRATRPRWLLEELGVPYELVRLSREDLRKPAYAEVHPLGQVPALEDEGIVIFESAAIVKYLADKFQEKGFAPRPGTKERGAYEQWIMFAMATLEPLVVQYSAHTKLRAEDKRVPALADEAKASFTNVAKPLEELLAKQPYVLGERFSAADVIVGSVTGWAAANRFLGELPALRAYVDRVKLRPAWIRARED